jgi:hypothetical protein
MPGKFLETSPFQEKLCNVKVVLITTLCSKSGVANPVNFVVSEGEDVRILRDLSLGYTDIRKVADLAAQHRETLQHAFRFPRVQGVVYTTRSLVAIENEDVVTAAIEHIDPVVTKSGMMPFRTAPPVLPVSESDIETENPVVGKFLKYLPSTVMSGCFVSVITREAQDAKEAAKEILSRAAARGIIAGVPRLPAVTGDLMAASDRNKKAVRRKKAAKKRQKGKIEGEAMVDDYGSGIDAAAASATVTAATSGNVESETGEKQNEVGEAHVAEQPATETTPETAEPEVETGDGRQVQDGELQQPEQDEEEEHEEQEHAGAGTAGD